MKIETLRLVNYRNYLGEHDFQFKQGINVVHGRNAQGKTNLLEAIFLLSRGYAHRLKSLKDAVHFESPGFYLRATTQLMDIHHQIVLKYVKGKKTVQLDGKDGPGREALLKVFPTVLFVPDDLKMIKEGPSRRRAFLDTEIAAFRPGYAAVLREYRNILSQRGALLRDIRYKGTDPHMLSLWDGQLVQAGTRIIRHRMDYLQKLNLKARELHSVLSDDNEKLTLHYISNVLQDKRDLSRLEATYTQRLNEGKGRDLERLTTGIGPHLDDFSITINDRDTRLYGSQGQQRTVAIALILSEIEIFKDIYGTEPVVLLDDVLSELDIRRQQSILSLLRNTQTFITCTDSSFIPEEIPVHTIEIEGGKQI